METKIKDGKLLYHLVPLESLESIIMHGLMSRDNLEKNNIQFVDTANQDILRERKRLNLSQYIPFHFHIHTAYDTAVKNENHRTFVYICVHRNFAKSNHFFILPIHPASNEQPQLFTYDEGFKRIDWSVMELNKPEIKSHRIEERYHQQVRMAECLSPITIPVNCFQSINVPNEETQNYVNDLLESYSVKNKPYVNIRNWFVS